MLCRAKRTPDTYFVVDKDRDLAFCGFWKTSPRTCYPCVHHWNRKCTLNNRGLMISYLYFKGNLLERKSHTAVSWDWIILYIVQSFPTFYFLSFLFCYTFISLCCLICSKMIGMTQHYYSLNFLSKLLYCCTGLSIYEHHLEASIICFSANRIQTD